MWKNRLLFFARAVTSIVVTFFPLLVLFLARHNDFRFFFGIALLFFLMQCVFALKNKGAVNFSLFPGLIGLALGVLSLILDKVQVFLWYPVFVNLALLSIFGFSLVNAPSAIERIARLMTKDLPAKAITYLKNVTKIWCFFFIFNGLIAAWTASQDNLVLWSLWNGCFSYICIGVLLLGEWVYRKLVLNV